MQSAGYLFVAGQIAGQPVVLEAARAAGVALAALLSLVFVCGGMWLIYYLLTVPMRRRERAMVFLDIIETGLRRGATVGETLGSALAGGVRLMGQRFAEVGMLAAEGAPLGAVLREVHGFVPDSMAAMVAAGERIGDLARVLPACRRTLTDAASRVRGAVSYLIVLASMFFVFGVVMLGAAVVYVGQRFRALLMSVGGQPPDPFAFMSSGIPVLLLAVVSGLIVLATVLYVGGPRLVRWAHLGGVAERFALAVPWRRRRLHRDFSAMLALLLDAGVPEDEALALAAASTGNARFARRAEAAAEAIRQGEKLTDAVARLDRSGEFRWRLTSAAHRGANFARALAGWHESLEARAFQQEQAAAHAITTAIVLFHGAMVALFAIGVFQCLIRLTEASFTW